MLFACLFYVHMGLTFLQFVIHVEIILIILFLSKVVSIILQR